jgi:nucleotidyltransferase substrate binding protein (TIGR01987 family)
MEATERFYHFRSDWLKALVSLEEILNVDLILYDEKEQDWIKNGQIQKFEICTELMWKTLRFYLSAQEFDVPDAPKKLLKHALLQGFLLEEEYLQLYEALELRNRLSHIYKLAVFEEALPILPIIYKTMRQVYDKLQLA